MPQIAITKYFLLLVCLGVKFVVGGKIKPHLDSRNSLPGWAEDRFIDCTFCLDYDDFRRLSIFGCRFKQTPTCRGNVCYMRQHKNPAYFLFTSGCLNLTQNQYQVLQYLTNRAMPDRESSNATQLCEVSEINTCLCTSKDKCNNVSVHDPFIEYVVPIFRDTDFDEVAHFKYFLPNDPVLENVVGQANRDEYFLIKSISSHSNLLKANHIITCIFLILFMSR